LPLHRWLSRNKLRPYNGEDSLETFLAKFDQMAKYLKWHNSYKFHHLCASLEGAAGQVLWGLKSDATADSVISLLRTRFGNELQCDEIRGQGRPIYHSLRHTYPGNSHTYLFSIATSQYGPGMAFRVSLDMVAMIEGPIPAKVVWKCGIFPVVIHLW